MDTPLPDSDAHRFFDTQVRALINTGEQNDYAVLRRAAHKACNSEKRADISVFTFQRSSEASRAKPVLNLSPS